MGLSTKSVTSIGALSACGEEGLCHSLLPRPTIAAAGDADRAHSTAKEGGWLLRMVYSP